MLPFFGVDQAAAEDDGVKYCPELVFLADVVSQVLNLYDTKSPSFYQYYIPRCSFR